MTAIEEIQKVVDDFLKEPRLQKKTENMGKGLLLGASLADESNERSKDSKNTATAIQEKYKEQILAHDLDPNKDPEIIDLRSTYETAGERVEKVEDDILKTISYDKLKVRPETYNYDYELSPAKIYSNFLTQLKNGDLTKLKIVFGGDSHVSGQGATETGGEKVPQLAPPSGVSDGFHKRDNSSGTFSDKVAREMKEKYGLSITKRTVSNADTTYNLPTGLWTQATDQRMLEASGQPAFHTSSTPVNSFIKKFDSTKQQRCATIHFIKLPSGGKLDVHVRTNNPSVNGLTRDDAFVWKKPSEMGLIRSDGVTGTALDTIDLYAVSSDYGYSLGFTFPFFANWHLKFTVSSSKNASSTGNLCSIGTTVLDHENFVNAGRGNHTTLDYLGNTVSKGAGSGGDHTDHVAEILALKPSLVILEPMIINDWLHGQSLQDTISCIQEMIKRFKGANCDVLLVTPGPLVTEDVILDYAENPDYSTAPPLVNNLNNQGDYEDYVDAALKAAYWEQVPVINNYKYFLERFHKEDHQNWTIGTQAGRIHYNQYGHNIYAEGIIQFSGLFPKTVLSN